LMDINANPHPKTTGLPTAAELLNDRSAWTPELFRKLNFMSGLEIHQQIATEKKLFCHCDARLQPGVKPDARLLRHMRPTLSEMGTYDGTALMEFKTKKEVVYELLGDVSCTYEMDDTPPFLINDEALDKALAIAMLFNCSLVDELHIARKQYLDGSIPTGFQRTAIVGVNGWVPFKDRKVRIRQISIEEDSCREVSDEGHQIVFRTDRLGFPLLEVVTEPDAHDPWELAEIGRLLGDIMRSSGMVRRGLGASRQDVNVSIGGSTRVEIKGVSKIGFFPQLTATEALRHNSLLELAEELKRRGITEPEVETLELDGKLVGAAEGEQGLAIKLKGFGGLLNWQTQPTLRFVDELRGLIRVVACLTDRPIIHLPNENKKTETLPATVWETVRKKLKPTKKDDILLLRGRSEDLKTALEEITNRCKQAAVGVPNETRQALTDERDRLTKSERTVALQTDFERVLPGADRMYPDTDHPPQAITTERRTRLRKLLPEPLWERKVKLEAAGLSTDVVSYLCRERPAAELYDELLADYPKLRPVLVGGVLARWSKHLRRSYGRSLFCKQELVKETLAAVEKQALSEEAALLLFSDWAQKESPTDELLAKYPVPSTKETEVVLAEVLALKDGPTDPKKRHRWLMGEAQDRLHHRLAGKELEELLKSQM